MALSLRTMAVETFAPMLESLEGVLAKAEAQKGALAPALLAARLAPDMFTLAQQVQSACHSARASVVRLTGGAEEVKEPLSTDFAGLRAQIAAAIAFVRSVPEADFAGADAREIVVSLQGGREFRAPGADYLRAWAFPHFYFHVTTAYGLLRHDGVDIGKRDYVLGPAARFVTAKA